MTAQFIEELRAATADAKAALEGAEKDLNIQPGHDEIRAIKSALAGVVVALRSAIIAIEGMMHGPQREADVEPAPQA
jgi:hypothetical protein